LSIFSTAFGVSETLTPRNSDVCFFLVGGAGELGPRAVNFVEHFDIIQYLGHLGDKNK